MTDTEEVTRHRHMICMAGVQDGIGEPHGWRMDDEERRVVATFGRFMVTEDDDNEGIFSGDEGELTAQVVGGIEHGNERVAFFFTADGMDSGNEVRDVMIVEAVA